MQHFHFPQLCREDNLFSIVFSLTQPWLTWRHASLIHSRSLPSLSLSFSLSYLVTPSIQEDRKKQTLVATLSFCHRHISNNDVLIKKKTKCIWRQIKINTDYQLIDHRDFISYIFSHSTSNRVVSTYRVLRHTIFELIIITCLSHVRWSASKHVKIWKIMEFLPCLHQKNDTSINIPLTINRDVQNRTW